MEEQPAGNPLPNDTTAPAEKPVPDEKPAQNGQPAPTEKGAPHDKPTPTEKPARDAHLLEAAARAGAPSIVFSDMDGTFLMPDKSVSALNLRALDALAEAGIPFVICTGRAGNALPQDILAHPAARYVVCANGAYTLDTQTGARMDSIGLPRHAALDLYELTRPLDVVCDLFADGVAYSKEEYIARLPEFIAEKGQLEFVMRTRVPTPYAIPELVERVEQLDRISIFYHSDHDHAAIMEYLDAHPELAHASSCAGVIEITNANATKGSALAHLCDRLGIDRSRAFAFGDHLNDTSMLESAGVGVAMANAQPEILAIADARTLSNVESGVGAFILAALGLDA